MGHHSSLFAISSPLFSPTGTKKRKENAFASFLSSQIPDLLEVFLPSLCSKYFYLLNDSQTLWYLDNYSRFAHDIISQLFNVGRRPLLSVNYIFPASPVHSRRREESDHHHPSCMHSWSSDSSLNTMTDTINDNLKTTRQQIVSFFFGNAIFKSIHFVMWLRITFRKTNFCLCRAQSQEEKARGFAPTHRYFIGIYWSTNPHH